MKIIQKYPLAVFAAVTALMTVFLIGSRDLWFSDEIRYADAYSNLLHLHKWVVLSLNGVPYPDKPPVYFWLVWLVNTLTGTDIPSAMFLTSALTGFMYLACHYYFSMQVTKDKELSFVSGLILLTNFYFLALINYIRMDLLFASLILLSFAFVYKYLTENRVSMLYAAFMVGSAAVMVKGPLGIAFPVLLFILSAFFMRAPKKLFTKHTLFALLAATLPIIAWLLAIIYVEGAGFAEELLYKQVFKRAVSTWHHQEPFYYYAYTLPLAWLPWFLMIFTKKSLKISGAMMKNLRGGLFVTTAAVSGFLLLSILSGKITIYALPLFSPVAIYFAWLYRNGDRSKFWIMTSVFFVAVAIGLPFINKWKVVTDPVQTAPAAVFALVVAVCVYFIRRKSWAVIAFTGLIVVFFNIAGLTVIKGMDNLMSPRLQAEKMGEYIRSGYEPYAYKVYSGLYTYYAGSVIHETKSRKEILAELESGDKVVLGIAEKHWNGFKERPENVEIVDRQWVAGRTYLLIINK